MRKGALAAVVSLALVGSLSLGVAPARADDPPPPTAEEQAAQQARETDRPVEVPTLTNENEITHANPDGTFTLTSSREAARVRDGDAWVPVDTSLAAGPGGRIRPSATVADMSFSPGGTRLLATTGIDGQQLAFEVPFDLPAPAIEDNTLTYTAVLPDVDLVVSVSAEAFSEVLVVKTPEAAQNPLVQQFQLNLSATGLDVSVHDDGSTQAVNPTGEVVFHSPAPAMWDSTTSPQSGAVPSATEPGDSQTIMDIEVTDKQQTSRTVSKSEITVTPDTDMLTDPQAQFPIFIDPTFSASRVNFTVVRSGLSSYSNNTDVLRVGYCAWDGCTPYYKARSYFNFNTATILPHNGVTATVHKASVHFTQIHSAAGAATPVGLHESYGFGTSTTYPGPIGTHLMTQSTTSGVDQVSFSNDAIRAYLQDAATRQWGHTSFALMSPNENDAHQWKRFDNDPTLSVTYSYAPSVPDTLGLYSRVTCPTAVYTRTSTPGFLVKATDNNPSPGQVTVRHEIWNSSGAFVVSGNTTGASTATQTWFSPVHLPNGLYRHRARAEQTRDGVTLTSAYTPLQTFVVDYASPGSPTIRSATHPPYHTADGVAYGNNTGTFHLSVPSDPAIAGYTYSWKDSTVPSPTNTTCHTTSQTSPDKNTGFIKATNGQASLPLPPHLPHGSRILYVKAIDEAGNVSNNVDVITDYQFYITPSGQQVVPFEAENLTLGGTAPRAVVTDNAYAGGKHIVATPTAVGQTLTMTFNVPSTGRWQLQPTGTNAPNNARLEFAIDGAPIGTTGIDDNGIPYNNPYTVELYSSESRSRSFTVELEQPLTAGNHTLTIKVNGKHLSSTGYRFTVDQFRLVQEPQQ